MPLSVAAFPCCRDHVLNMNGVGRRGMAKRKLTIEEMTRFREWAREREHRNHPGARIQIIVKEETDEDGNLIY